MIGLALNLIRGPLGPHDLLALRSEQRHLESVRGRLVEHNAALSARIVKLKSDDAYIEHLIRRELGYARPDELVYKFADRVPK